jgi:aryl-alcohol dehydrogenase-like predicted oxidoreductase
VFATAEGTARFADRFSEFRNAAFYRTVRDLSVSSLGIGTYLAVSTDALLAAAEHGINFWDAAINYQQQQSERCIGEALSRLQRDEIVVCTKAGFLTKGAVPEFLKREDTVGGWMHSMAPEFLEDQIDRSRANMNVDTIDVFYLHNPETQLGFHQQDEFESRIRRAFARLETLVERRKIRWYGAATWEGFRKKGALNLPRLAEIAQAEGGPEHHFRFVQLPFNLGMVEAFVDRPENVLESAARLGIAVVASATLSQTKVLSNMPEAVPQVLPGLANDAQRAIQFTRSTPGISVALVGMGSREHVLENIGVARVPPAAPRRVFAALPVMTSIDVADESAFESLPNSPAVFVLWPREGRPHLSKTAVLRRRLLRLFKAWNLQRNRQSRGVPAHGVRIRIRPGSLRTGAASVSGYLSADHPAAHAAVRQDRPQQ